MSSISALANARLMSRTPRTGSDESGNPTFGAEQIKTPVRCIISDPNYIQTRNAEAENFHASLIMTIHSSIAMGEGDHVQVSYTGVSNNWFAVRKISVRGKVGLGAQVCYLEEVKI